MDDPDDRNKESIKEEHDGFFLQDTELRAVNILKTKTFHKNSHHSSSKEKTKGILQAERVFVLTASTVHFDIGEYMQDVGYAELVENDDEEHGEQSSRQGLCLQTFYLWWFGIGNYF